MNGGACKDRGGPRLSSPLMQPPLSSLCLQLFLLSLLVLLSAGSSHAISPIPIATTVTIPTQITSQYRFDRTASFFAHVDGPSELQGVVSHEPANYGTHAPFTHVNAAGVPFFQAELVLPHEDDDIEACASDSLRTTNEFNETFTGKILLLRRGFCSFGVKSERAAAAGANALVVFGCSTAPPQSCSPDLNMMSASAPSSIFNTYISTPDGFLMYDYLVSRREHRKNASSVIPPPITLSFVSTGPLLASERASLVSLMSISSMNQDTFGAGIGSLRPLNAASAADTTLDPCLDRLATVYCESGRIVQFQGEEMEWISTDASQPFPKSFGSFPALRKLWLNYNFFAGAIPTELCALNQMVLMQLDLQTGNGLTSVPACIDQLTQLQLLSIQGNQIGPLFPDISAMTNLTWLDISSNQIITLPDSFPRWNQLQYVDFSHNQIQSLPTLNGYPFKFQNFTSLQYLSFASNKLNFDVTADFFAGCSQLQVLAFNDNALTGVLPSLSGCSALSELSFDNNLFNSSIPLEWRFNIPQLTKFTAANNALVSPACTLTTLLHLNYIDLRYNRLTADTGVPVQFGNVGAFLSCVASSSTVHLLLDHNNIAGFWESGWLATASQLQELSLSHNGITILPVSLFQLTFTSLDVSSNNISSWNAVQAPGSNVILLNLLDNPALSVDEVPDWIVAGQQMVSNPGEDFLCPTLSSSSSKLMRLMVDSSFTKYKGCACAKGTFGLPPLCKAVPLTAVLTATGDFYSPEIGSDFNKIVALTKGRLPPRIPNGTTTAIVDDSDDRSFGDAWYGNARLTLGISTSWVIDTSVVCNSTQIAAERAASASALGGSVATTNTSSTDQLIISPSDLDTRPVLYVRIRFYISRSRFTTATDVLTVYEGLNQTGSRVAMISGSDTLPDVGYKLDALSGNITLINSNELTISDGLQNPDTYMGGAYWGEVREMNDTAVWEVVVFGAQATVSFQSRDESGTHFAAFYTYNRDFCPVGYFYDTDLQRCRPDLVKWEADMALRASVFAAGALAFCWVLFNAAVILLKFESSIVRAASPAFLLLTLFFLGLMALGSLLYASIPTDDARGRFICQTRGWLAAWPMTGILAVLFAKSNRLTRIFGSKNLQAKKVTDTDLLISVLVMLSLVSVFLAVYSGMPLTVPLISEGTGTLTGRLVASCHNTDEFNYWIAALLAFMFCLVIAAAFIAFKSRNLPSRFNESNHIWNAILLLLFYGCLIVPLVFEIQDYPNAAMLLQGVGQSLLCFLLTNVLFTPKLWVLYVEGRVAAAAGGDQFTMDKTRPTEIGVPPPQFSIPPSQFHAGEGMMMNGGGGGPGGAGFQGNAANVMGSNMNGAARIGLAHVLRIAPPPLRKQHFSIPDTAAIAGLDSTNASPFAPASFISASAADPFPSSAVAGMQARRTPPPPPMFNAARALASPISLHLATRDRTMFLDSSNKKSSSRVPQQQQLRQTQQQPLISPSPFGMSQRPGFNQNMLLSRRAELELENESGCYSDLPPPGNFNKSLPDSCVRPPQATSPSFALDGQLSSAEAISDEKRKALPVTLSHIQTSETKPLPISPISPPTDPVQLHGCESDVSPINHDNHDNSNINQLLQLQNADTRLFLQQMYHLLQRGQSLQVADAIQQILENESTPGTPID